MLMANLYWKARTLRIINDIPKSLQKENKISTNGVGGTQNDKPAPPRHKHVCLGSSLRRRRCRRVVVAVLVSLIQLLCLY